MAGGRGVVRARGVREDEGHRGAMRGRRRKQGRALLAARFGKPAHRWRRGDAQGAVASFLYMRARAAEHLHQPFARMHLAPPRAGQRWAKAAFILTTSWDAITRAREGRCQELRREKMMIQKMPCARITRKSVKHDGARASGRCQGVAEEAGRRQGVVVVDRP